MADRVTVLLKRLRKPLDHKAKPLPKFILENAALPERTYYQMGGVARYLAQPCSFAEVRESINFACSNALPIAVLGTGSNSVFCDGTFDGLVIALNKLSSWYWESETCLYAEAGVTNTEVAEICLAHNRKGASWMFRMPGQLGATVRMNARCFGGEISQIAIQVITIDSAGCLRTRVGSEIFRGYKDTLLMQTPEIVLATRLNFPDCDVPETLLAHMESCEAERHSKHHFDHPSCGSTFKNNYAVGKPSGRVFDELGLKGTRVGDSEVSAFHANFVWNLGRATTQDFLLLTAQMREVAMKAGADLELEVQPIGVFSRDLYQRCGMEKLGPALLQQDKYWVGLFSDTSLKETKTSYPHLLSDAPFQTYTRSMYDGLINIFARVEQLTSLSVARARPDTALLKWSCRVEGDVSKIFPLLPPASDGSFVDELWKYSVAEVFVADATQPGCYFEFELTPNLHWIALHFEKPRTRQKGFENASAALWPITKLTRFSEKNAFGFYFSYAALKPLLSSNEIRIQSMLSLGNGRYFLAPHWKSRQTQYETHDHEIQFVQSSPDFHQPDRFWKLSLKD